MTVQERFKDSLCGEYLKCNKKELEEYVAYGMVFKDGNNYLDRHFKELKIIYPCNFNINLSNIISDSLKLSKEFHNKRVYCMKRETFEFYRNLGLIVQKDNIYYFRRFENEEWLVNLIDKE